MPDERHMRARELLDSSGIVVFYKERQLIKENRFEEVAAVLRKRLRRTRIFVVSAAALMSALFLATLFIDPYPSWMDYVSVAGFLVLFVITEYGNRRAGSTLKKVESVLSRPAGTTGSDDSQALS